MCAYLSVYKRIVFHLVIAPTYIRSRNTFGCRKVFRVEDVVSALLLPFYGIPTCGFAPGSGFKVCSLRTVVWDGACLQRSNAVHKHTFQVFLAFFFAKCGARL